MDTPPSLLHMQSRYFFATFPHFPRSLVFHQAAKIKIQPDPLFPRSPKAWQTSSNRGQNRILFKTHSKMPLLSLTDLCHLARGIFFFCASLSIMSKRLQLIIYSGIWGGRGLKLNWALSNCLNISWIWDISRGNAHLNLRLLCHSPHQEGMHLLFPSSIVTVEIAPHSRSIIS